METGEIQASSPIITPSVMQFIVFAIECTAQKMHLPASDIFNRMNKIGLIEKILVNGYDALHTQSKEYIADAVSEAIYNWEEYFSQQKGHIS